MRISRNAILVTAGVLFLATAIYFAWDYSRFRTFLTSKMEILPKAIASDDKTPSKVISLKISGMTCGGCEAHIEDALIKLQGVKKVEVNYKQGSAIVTINPEEVDAQVLVETVTKAGYSADQKSP